MELRQICQEILTENEKAVKDYLGGKSKAFKALMAAVSKKTDNRADMKKCNDIVKNLLSERLKK